MLRSTFLERAGRWFVQSGIQEPDGGVARYYRSDTRRNVPVSHEITGYAVSTFKYLHAAGGAEEYLDKALLAARYLVQCAWNERLQCFPFEPAHRLTYFFDSGIIVRGLLSIWRAAGEAEFLRVAVACGRAMAKDFSSSDSDFHPILTLPGKEPLPREARWSRSPGCYQLKSAMAWYDLFEVTGDASFRVHYQHLLDYSLRTHAEFLPGEADPDRVMDRLHAYCYFLEGLLPCAAEKRVAAILCDGLRRVAELLRQIEARFVRSDVYAQLLRMRILADAAGAVPLDRAAAAHEAARLAEFQLEDEDPCVSGGFCFGRRGDDLLPFVNPVSAAFGLQALDFWESYTAGEHPHRHHLI